MDFHYLHLVVLVIKESMTEECARVFAQLPRGIIDTYTKYCKRSLILFFWKLFPVYFRVEPYLTMKMKCFYCEDIDYGVRWKSIMNSKPCQDELFSTCFANRSMAGRRETHVLTFIRRCDIRRCYCSDVFGWCKVEGCPRFPDVKCCLDRGKDSVMCRK